MTKAFTAALDRPWAITEAGLRQVLTIANRESLDIEAVETQLGRKLANTQSVMERDGVAIVPINGPIARHANLFSAISGATSIELLARDFAAALNNAAVRAILLQMDTPGGEVNGVAEFADQVYAARGKKPIYAYVGGLCASAGYWIASAADAIICDQTALLGSIGVIAAVPDPAYDSAGDVVFVSSQSPKKRPDPTTDEGKSDIQTTIDSLAQIFVETVARNRGVDADTVLTSFGQGGVFVGKEAVTAGLADRLGSFEDVLAQLAQRQQNGAQRLAATSTMRGSDAETAWKGYLNTAHPSLPSTSIYPAPLASVPTRVHTLPTLPQEISMSEQLPDVQAVDPPATLPPLALPPVNDAAMQAQINAYTQQMEARYQANNEAAFQRAQQEFERRISEMEARRQIESYAQNATAATLTRQHALPLEAETLTAFLSSLSASQRTAATGLFDRVLDAGLVSFEEIGSSADGDARDAAERWDAAVTAKVATGMARSAAISAVMKQQPDLYREYSAAGKKGGR